MGEDVPETPPTEYGDDCGVCFPPGLTPNHALVTFEGVELCPGRSWPNGKNLNRRWILTQVGGGLPCVWFLFEGDWTIRLVGKAFVPIQSRLRASIHDFDHFYFASLYMGGPCGTFFENKYDEGNCNGGIYGHSGTANVVYL